MSPIGVGGFSCDTCVLVVTPREAVANWARKPIVLGRGGRVEPLVIGPKVVPIVSDISRAVDAPELAVLSALAHGNERDVGLQVALAAMAAAHGLEDERGLLYSDLVLTSINKAMRVALEEIMSSHPREYQSDFAKRHQALGRADGSARGVIGVLEARKLSVEDAQRTRILSCTDLATLHRWLVRAVTATSADEIFED